MAGDLMWKSVPLGVDVNLYLAQKPFGEVRGDNCPSITYHSVAHPAMRHPPEQTPRPNAVPLEFTRSDSIARAKVYRLGDWLDLHALTIGQCEAVLHRTPAVRASNARARRCVISSDTAWFVAAHAVASTFPFAALLIERVRDESIRAFSQVGRAHSRPFTVPAGPERRPYVYLNFRGRVVDLLTVAHEFGHAVQIAATDGGFVPPVTREVCAFVSELALLAWLRTTSPDLHRHVLAAWEASNRRYLVRDGKALALALKDPQSVYRYGWNYPIARILASECVKQLPPDQLWAIFENQIPLAGIVKFLGCVGKNSPSCSGACIATGPRSFSEPVALAR
jgi:hypothetical protein